MRNQQGRRERLTLVSTSASLFFFAETASPLVSNPLPLLQSKCNGRPHCRVQGGARTQLLLNRPFPTQYPPEPLANSGHFSLSYWFSSNVFLASATLTDQSSLLGSAMSTLPLSVQPRASRSGLSPPAQKQWTLGSSGAASQEAALPPAVCA